MPLPDETAAKQPWPPTTWAPILRDITEAAAWYGGDANALAALYGGIANPESRNGRGRSFFWNRKKNAGKAANQAGERLHAPAAAEIATTAADLLFGDPPTFQIPAGHTETPDQAALDTEAYLAQRIEEGGVAAVLLEGAEIGSGLGGVYLRPYWDDAISDHCILTLVHPDHAVPEWRMGHMVAATFWSQVANSDGDVWRHLERYEPGRIIHGLYKGTAKSLGVRRPLAAMAATRGLEEEVDEDGAIALPERIPGLAVRYVPNVGPNRKHRGIPVGRSDCAGAEQLMDALDEAWSSLMRDIRMSKKRIIAPLEYLELGGRGQGAAFDMDREVFTPIDVDPANLDKMGILPVEMTLRVTEHLDAVRALFTEVVQAAGYAPQSLGLPGNGAQLTATEVDAREDRSKRTTDKKRRNWARPLEDVLYIMQVIDQELLGHEVEPMRPQIVWPVAQERDLTTTASIVNQLHLALAASISERVRLVHPDWDDERIQAQVELIKAENGTVGDPTGGFV